jgi:hypothetical protein
VVTIEGFDEGIVMASRKNFPGRLEARRQRAAERSALNNQGIEGNTQETSQANDYTNTRCRKSRGAIMGALAKRALVTLHHGLEGIGPWVAQLTVIALVAILFLVPLFAMLIGSFFMAFCVERLIGGGAFLIFAMVWVFIGLIGWYVSPHVQPQISEAMKALLKGI